MNAGVFLSFLVLGLVGVLAYRTINTYFNSNAQALRTHRVVITLEEFVSRLKDLEMSAGGFTITGDETFLDTYADDVLAMMQKQSMLRELLADSPSQIERLEKLDPLVKEKLALIGEDIDIRRTLGVDPPTIHRWITEGRQLTDRLRQQVTEIENEEDKLLGARRALANRDVGEAFLFFGLGLLLNLGLVAAVFYLMRRDLRDREMAARELQRSSEQVADLFNRAPCGYHSLDKDGLFTWMNDTELTWLGYTREEVVGRMRFTDLISEEEREKFSRNYPKFRERGFLRNREYELYRKDGRVLPVLLNSDVVRDERGIFSYTRSSMIEITDRKRSEQEREHARVYAESIVDTVHEPLIILTAEQRVKSANQSFYQLFGLTKESTEGRFFQEVLRKQRAVPGLVSGMESAPPFQNPLDDLELSLNTPKLGQRIFMLSSRKITQLSHDTPLTLLAMEDVTERKRNERIHLQFRALFESLPGLYLVLTPDLNIVGASDAHLQATNRRRDEILGRPLFEVFPGNEARDGTKLANSLNASFARVLETGEADTVAIQRYDIKGANGEFELRYWSVVNSPVLGVDKRLEYIIHRVEDITEFVMRKQKTVHAGQTGLLPGEQMEAEVFLRANELQTVNAQLRAANDELEAFSYSVSHDLRAPLRHIDGFADMLKLQSRDRLDEKGQRYLSTISDSAKRMGQLIDDLLIFARLGRAEMRFTRVNLNSLVEEVRHSLDPEVRDRAVTWKIAALPEVKGDPALLRQIFTNLLSNALKYSRNKSETVIEVGYRQENGETLLFVRDNGAGFDMKYAAKLFRVFQRLHSISEFEGTGVGLAIVRRVIQRHGGRIWAEGKIDEGATFYFTLSSENTGAAQS